MVSKIISGGQAGAERAALDVAMDMDIRGGGWIARGRRTEHGLLPLKDQMSEMPADGFTDLRERNIIDSDGTLIVSREGWEDDSELTGEMARKHRRPWLQIDLDRCSVFFAASDITYWIHQYDIEVLNVTGPDSDRYPGIYRDTAKLLKAVLNMDVFGLFRPGSSTISALIPKTVDEAIDRLMAELPLKDRIRISRMDADALLELDDDISAYIRNHYGLRQQDSELMKSCRLLAEEDDLNEESASAVIAHGLWKRIKQTYSLRILSNRNGGDPTLAFPRRGA